MLRTKKKMTAAFALGMMQQADSTPVSLKYREKKNCQPRTLYPAKNTLFLKHEAEIIFPDIQTSEESIKSRPTIQSTVKVALQGQAQRYQWRPGSTRTEKHRG